MKKIIKKIGIMLGCLMVIPSVTMPVLAAEEKETEGIWEDGSLETLNQVEDTYRPILRASTMYQGYVRLQEENGKAGVYGETLALRTSDKVGLDIYLDKYNGTSYGTYTYWKTAEYNTSMNIKSYTVSVPKGYYYRLHGYHYVSDGSDFENGETITQGLKIPQ